MAMGFVMAALRNTTFLCGAIVVTAAVMMLGDLSELAAGPLILAPVDISHPLLILLVARYLHCVEGDADSRGLIKGVLCALVLMFSIMYVVI